MRTRYLATDFFSQTPRSHLHDRIPLLPIPTFASGPTRPPLLDVLDLDLEVPMCLQVDRFPIEEAVARFVSEVIPKMIEGAGTECCADESHSEDVEDLLYGDDYCMPNISNTEIFKAGVPQGGGAFVVRSDKENHEIFEFEMIEMEFPSKNKASSQEGERIINFDLPPSCINQANIDVQTGVEIPYPYELVRLIYSVESTPIHHLDNGGICSGEIAGIISNANAAQLKVIPLLEISEVELVTDKEICTKDTFDVLQPYFQQFQEVRSEKPVICCEEFELKGSINELEDVPQASSVEDIPGWNSISFDSVLEMEVIKLKGNMLFENNSSIDSTISNDFCSQKPCSVDFQEVQILDVPSFNSFEMFCCPQKENAQEMSEQMLKKDMVCAGEFYESIVSAELVLVDETFKSLPVPTLWQKEDSISSCVILKKLLHDLKLCPVSTCDGIYLDWHLLGESTCSREACYRCMDMLTSVNIYQVPSEMCNDVQEKSAIELSFFDDMLEREEELHCKEVHMELSASNSSDAFMVAASIPYNISKDEREGPENMHRSPKLQTEIVSSLFASMSQHNDLNFFLNARRGTSVKTTEDSNTEKNSEKTTHPVFCSIPSSSEVITQHCNIKVHGVCLSNHILCMVDSIYKCYMDILHHNASLDYKIGVNRLELLGLPKEKFMEIIMDIFLKQQVSAREDDVGTTLIALYGLRQLAHLLCYFGIPPAYIYARNLFQQLPYISTMLEPIMSLLETAKEKTWKEITEAHPSFSVIEEILISNSCQHGKKTLIVANRAFWLSLTRKLSSMKIFSKEVKPSQRFANQQDVANINEFTKSIADALLHFDCVFISYEYLSESLPFTKFDIVLEYGGSHSSSKIASIGTNVVSFPRVFFLTTKIEDSSTSKALCEGFGVSSDHEFRLGIAQPVHGGKQSTRIQKILELLNFMPLEEFDYSAISESEEIQYSTGNGSSFGNQNFINAEVMNSSVPSFTNTLIVFNTRDTEKEMLMSRRSTYQKVLALEKRGLQVIERDSSLPVDIIFSAAMCLVWYNINNIGKRASSADEQSCIVNFMENIATNVMMELSFAFKTCIMIFEGESSFIDAVMDSSGVVYAAAVGLNIRLQLFCSYSADTTDGIILNCIEESAADSGLYPKMLESETLAESFLTRFPSINPLSAHAILSSSGCLVEFLEWLHDRRIQAVGKYKIPDESMSLFSNLCRYGELGGSKSGTTDCSSMDSDLNSTKLQSQVKRQKFAVDSDSIDWNMNDLLNVKALDQVELDASEPSPKSHSGWSRDCFSIQGAAEKNKLHNLPTINDIFCENGGDNTSIMENISFDEDFNVKEGFGVKMPNYNTDILDGKFSNRYEAINFFMNPEFGSKPISNSFVDGRTQPKTISHAVLPSSVRINHTTRSLSSLMKDHTNNKPSRTELPFIPGGDSLHMKGRADFSRDKAIHRNSENVIQLSNQAKLAETYSDSLFSNAIRSSRLRKGPKDSPWTPEFFNKFKENSGTPSQFLTCNTCLDCPEGSRKRDMNSRNRSPSFIDSFRYKGGVPPKTTVYRKLQQTVGRPGRPSKNNKRISSAASPTLTPVDKRARQNLSYIRNGNDKQSRLVWRNMSIPNVNHNFNKRYREEA